MDYKKLGYRNFGIKPTARMLRADRARKKRCKLLGCDFQITEIMGNYGRVWCEEYGCSALYHRDDKELQGFFLRRKFFGKITKSMQKYVYYRLLLRGCS